MKIILIGPELEENLALGYLSSALIQAGHLCRIVSFNHPKDIYNAVRTTLHQNPDIIGFSLVAQCRYADYQKMIQLLRDRGFKGHITAGGHFAGLRAAEIIRDTPGIDTILHHDGERRIVALVNSLAVNGTIPDDVDGITWRAADGTLQHRPAIHVAPIDSLPFPLRRSPDRTLGYFKAPVISSRGCSGSCSFCSIHAWHKQVPNGRLRFRSPDNIAKEMIDLHKKYNIRVFIFHDDDFIHPDKWQAFNRCRQFLELAERGIGKSFAFVIKCRPDDVDENLFRYLKTKGLVRTYIGIENHSTSGIAALNRRVTPEANLRALKILKQLDIYSCFNLLLFHPDSTSQEVQENLEFLKQHLDHPFDVARTELYARSILEQRMLDQGRAKGDYRGYDYKISDPQVETAFQLFTHILWDRHFKGQSILHRIQDLGLRLNLLRYFRPDLVPSELNTRMNTLIKEVNTDTIDYLHYILSMAEQGNMLHSRSILEMRREVENRVKYQLVKWAALSLELEGRSLMGRCGFSELSPLNRLPELMGRFAATFPFMVIAVGCFSTESVCDPPPPPIHFTKTIEPKLSQSCAQVDCHSINSAQAGLELETGAGYSALVNVPSTQAASMVRVKPYNPYASYLLHKLENTHIEAGGSGDMMPKNGKPDAQLIDDINLWILNGSKND